MSTLRFALAAATALIVSGCALNVRSDADHTLLSTVHCGSYAWAGAFRGSSPLRNTIANPLNEERLRGAIASHLAPAAVSPAGSPADCLVGYGIGGDTVVDGGGTYWGYGYGYGYPWGPWGYWGGGPYVYREGIIAVDVYDAHTRKPLWHASADQSLFNAAGAEAQKRIDAAVTAIFAKRPAGV